MKILRSLWCGFFIFIVFFVTPYTNGTELKILPSDGKGGDSFGRDLAISGDCVIVGAAWYHDNIPDSGAAYIFRRSGTSWIQEAKLTASDGQIGDSFGVTVGISGDYAIIGARYDDDQGLSSGSAYVFKRGDSAWGQVAKLTASDDAEGDQFGRSVSISGDYAIVGSSMDDDNGNSSGSAYIYQNVGDTWIQAAKLTANDGAGGEVFGHAVGISGDYAIVSALGYPAGTYSGAVYIFWRNGATWNQIAKFTEDGGQIGVSVAIAGNYAIAGARFDSDVAERSGAAYVYERSGTNWSLSSKLTASDGISMDEFGADVGISGEYAIVGAFSEGWDNSRPGAAYIFQRIDTGWVQVDKLMASDGVLHDEFGFRVGISGNYAIVGANYDDDNGTGSGSAYIFDYNQGNVDNSTISGQVISTVTGQTSNMKGAIITILETGLSVTSDAEGIYIFANIPSGAYTIKIEKAGFEAVIISDIEVLGGQTTFVPVSELVLTNCEKELLGDINEDGKIGIEEAIHALQVVAGIRSEPPAPGETYTNSLGMTFKSIPAGTFTMGSPTDEPGRSSNETQHQVTLSQSFYMQTTEVTQGQWQSVMGSNPSHFQDCGDGCPVEQVSWDDIQDFLTALNSRGEGTYRLPTEAEWEYAARAGSITAFPSGDITVTDCEYDTNLDAVGWYCGNADVAYDGCEDWSTYNGKPCVGTHPAAQKQPNAWGLYDMIGNVWEWCQDWYGDYPSASVYDPEGPTVGSSRVTRGGTWYAKPQYCRTAYRGSGHESGFTNPTGGFRLVLPQVP